MNDDSAKGDVTSSDVQEQHHIILFYKYTKFPAISDQSDLNEKYRAAMEVLCQRLGLCGRVLIGYDYDSNEGDPTKYCEGINGTLSGDYWAIICYCTAMMGRQKQGTYYYVYDDSKACDKDLKADHRSAVKEFWDECDFLVVEDQTIVDERNVFTMMDWEDFKFSTHTFLHEERSQKMFPDCKISVVKEIINTGGKLDGITMEDVGQGYLTPDQWHEAMQSEMHEKDAVLIDCRNHKEYSIGRFDGAVDPNTRTFCEFFDWVKSKESQGTFSDKKVFMYCTGGIRCEKASAFVRQSTGAKDVYHLKGGIHRYLEKYGRTGHFRGKNFVFDRRIAQGGSDCDVVGQCRYCDKPWDQFQAGHVCTVCRELVLVCDECNSRAIELHCSDHKHLQTCYFTDLSRFNERDLRKHLFELEAHLEQISVGKAYKQKRRTLQKQHNKVCLRLEVIEEEKRSDDTNIKTKSCDKVGCRSCGSIVCNGACWGFHGLQRTTMLKEKRMCEESVDDASDKAYHTAGKFSSRSRQSSNQRAAKVKRKEGDIDEIKRLGLNKSSTAFRDSITGIRCPPPCIRIIQSSVKGKWCGKPVMSVLKAEFNGFDDDAMNKSMVSRSLIRINDVPITTNQDYRPTLLRNMDSISRIVHWHEPPVVVPESISVNKVIVPDAVKEYILSTENNSDYKDDDFSIYVCNKPSSVPVHPAGPYLANTMTIMVEAEMGLEPRSLNPCHRIDRVTSGVVLCCSSVTMTRMVLLHMASKHISKLYVARVKGKFPSTKEECNQNISCDILPHATWTWSSEESASAHHIKVNANIETIDPSLGIRGVGVKGKSSESKFRFDSYDADSDTSIVLCAPITGRSHQLRVHLHWLGYPIHNDVQYGGECRGGEIMSLAIESVQSASKMEDLSSCSNPKVSLLDANLAREICPCCQIGQSNVISAFSSSQLLERGRYAIDLHALKYQINFFRKTKKKELSCEDDEFLATLEFCAKPPAWASTLSSSNPDFI